METVTSTVTVTPSGAATAVATDVQIWTLIVAGGAVLATVVSAWLLRRTGRGTVTAAKQAAAASERSAEAAEKSALAAQESVGVNRETAAGVAKRAHEDALSKRYQEATGQLGHEKSAVRLSGVYAMARLADDWPERRQQCVNVLCAYLRMSPPDSEIGEDQVRNTIVTELGDHLKSHHEPSWSSMRIDLTGAELHEMNFTDAVFLQRPDFGRMKVRGTATFANAIFDGGVDFTKAIFAGSLYLTDIKLNGQLDMLSVTFSPETLSVISIREIDNAASVNLIGAECHGDAYLEWSAGAEARGLIALGIAVRGGGRFTLHYPELTSLPQPPGRIRILPIFGVDVYEGGEVRLPEGAFKCENIAESGASDELIARYSYSPGT